MARQLSDSVSVLSGVGEKLKQRLHTLGIETVFDLLQSFPFRYEDFSVRDVREFEDSEKGAISGTVVTAPVVSYYGKGNRLNFRFQTNDVIINITLFNQPYMRKNIALGDKLLIYGTYDKARQGMTAIRIQNLSTKSETDDAQGIYHTTQGLSQKKFQTLEKQALKDYQELLPERLPQELVDHYHLPTYREAVGAMHFPKDGAQRQQAERRIKYEELFLYLFRLQWEKYQGHQETEGVQVLYDNEQLRSFIETLPFALTDGQKQVVNEICRDLRQPFSMRRLLQGDVGSGKTVVALIAMVATGDAGYQSALMVPTEILAEQHFASFNDFLVETDYNVALLTGQMPKRERTELLDGLASGTIDMVIGTHALIQEDVHFKNLGFAVIDEQHRFGVNQRAALVEKTIDGRASNLLYMTATPIPRTLEITTMGNMDVSKLTERPSNRKPIRTVWLKPNQKDQIESLLGNELAKGHQVYIVCPLIEESEAMAAQNAEHIYESLQFRYGDRYTLGLMHGKLSSDDKDAVMNAFEQNETQILVTTTVIEVGINVPNATAMVILNADHFGLAQLHQLRGRIGRGDAQSYCVLLADPRTDNGKKRMQMMTETADGFVLSQYDLELRGAGDYFGTKQSGWPSFALVDPVADQTILEAAKQDVERFLPYYLEQHSDYPGMNEWLETLSKHVNA